MRKLRTRVWVSGGLLAALVGSASVLAAGCSASSDVSGADRARSQVAEPAPAVGAGSGAASPGSGSASADSSGSASSGSGSAGSSGSASSGSAGSARAPLAAVSAAGRQVVRSAALDLTVADGRAVSTATDRAQGIAVGVGGYVASEQAGDQQATLTLEVPQAALDGVLARLAGLGTVTGRSQQAQDVTGQLVDVRSRIASQQASVDRVRALMNQAASLSDVVSLEGELTRRESDLEALEQQQAELAGQVAMSAVRVTVLAVPPPAPVVSTPSPNFLGGLAGGWRAFLTAVRVLGVALGAALPFLVVLGVPAAAGFVFWRRRRLAAR